MNDRIGLPRYSPLAVLLLLMTTSCIYGGASRFQVKLRAAEGMNNGSMQSMLVDTVWGTSTNEGELREARPPEWFRPADPAKSLRRRLLDLALVISTDVRPGDAMSRPPQFVTMPDGSNTLVFPTGRGELAGLKVLAAYSGAAIEGSSLWIERKKIMFPWWRAQQVQIELGKEGVKEEQP
ncbi:MAG: hypothetical protein ACKVX7_12940 [Planctomycetota bacterium]